MIQAIFILVCLNSLLLWGLGLWLLPRRVSRLWRGAVSLFILFQLGGLAAFFWVRLRHGNVETELPYFVLMSVYVWHLFLAPLALVWLLLGVVWRGGRRGFQWFARSGKECGQGRGEVMNFAGDQPVEPLAEPEGGLSRREFLGAVAVIAPPLLTFPLGAYAWRQLKGFRVREVEVVLPALPESLDGLRIAHLSDLHVGAFTNGPILEEVTRVTNEMKPDLAVFTGDLINSTLAALPPGAAALRAIDAPLFACEGNHDLFESAEGFARRMREAGLRLLQDEMVALSLRGTPVQVIGTRWSRNQTPAALAELAERRDRSVFTILLAHHPHDWDYCGDIPLTLAGHTHGGQFMLNERLGVGPVMFRYWSGLYTRGEGRERQALVVSNGAGNWFPLRVHAPAEIIFITLRRAG